MELKLRSVEASSLERLLLIEPYGIETKDVANYVLNNDRLLIEPYGIETPL